MQTSYIVVMLVQYDEIEPMTLLERCSLSETKYLLERCIGLIISKVCIIALNCQLWWLSDTIKHDSILDYWQFIADSIAVNNISITLLHVLWLNGADMVKNVSWKLWYSFRQYCYWLAVLLFSWVIHPANVQGVLGLCYCSYYGNFNMAQNTFLEKKLLSGKQIHRCMCFA